MRSQAHQQALAEVTNNIMLKLLDDHSANFMSDSEFSGLIVETGQDRYRIGEYILQKRDDSWMVIKPLYTESFYSKHAAVLYCLSNSKKNYRCANELLTEDRRLSHVRSDVDQYLGLLKNAAAKKDAWRKDLYMARLSKSRYELIEARSNLRKSITSAKYATVRENET
jgi:hypothetical protein